LTRTVHFAFASLSRSGCATVARSLRASSGPREHRRHAVVGSRTAVEGAFRRATRVASHFDTSTSQQASQPRDKAFAKVHSEFTTGLPWRHPAVTKARADLTDKSDIWGAKSVCTSRRRANPGPRRASRCVAKRSVLPGGPFDYRTQLPRPRPGLGVGVANHTAEYLAPHRVVSVGFSVQVNARTVRPRHLRGQDPWSPRRSVGYRLRRGGP